MADVRRLAPFILLESISKIVSIASLICTPKLFFRLVLVIGFCLAGKGYYSTVYGADIIEEVPYHTNKDFSDHWELLGEDFSKAEKSRKVSLTDTAGRYLSALIGKIKSNNKILFNNFKLKEEVFIVKDMRSFHFSTPRGRIFVSLGLLKKYVEYEGLLASILTIEMIRSGQVIFIKNVMVPTGVVSFERLRPLLRVDLDLKDEINRWAVYTLKKSGFNPLSLLRLLQIKSKNFLNFFEGQEESKDSVIEKTRLKKFLIRRKLFVGEDEILRNSSKGFYQFINEVKKHEYH